MLVLHVEWDGRGQDNVPHRCGCHRVEREGTRGSPVDAIVRVKEIAVRHGPKMWFWIRHKVRWKTTMRCQ